MCLENCYYFKLSSNLSINIFLLYVFIYNSLALTPISLSSSSFILLITKASLSLSSDGHTYPICYQ